jgi:hypothetical protein
VRDYNMNNLDEEKELLKEIYTEVENDNSLSEERKEELMQIISSLEKKYDYNGANSGILIKIKDNLKSIQVSGPETNIKTILKDTINAILYMGI